MTESNPPKWLEWAREIQAIAQTGDHYADNHYQHERYQRLLEIAAEMVNENGKVQYAPVLDAFREPRGYATPRIDVRGAVFQDGRLLLVREVSDGGWCLPGGWADVGDVPSEAAEREVWEEAGFKVKARKVIGIYDANRTGPLELFHAFKVVFLCDLISGTAAPSIETSEVSFFSEQEIPQILSPNRTSPRLIADAFAAYKDPARQTQFD